MSNQEGTFWLAFSSWLEFYFLNLFFSFWKNIRLFQNLAKLTCNRRESWQFSPTAMGHSGGRLVLLNFERIVYFSKIE
jgi:hypothetical protein